MKFVEESGKKVFRRRLVNYCMIIASIVSGGWLINISETISDDFTFALVLTSALLCLWIGILMILLQFVGEHRVGNGQQLRRG